MKMICAVKGHAPGPETCNGGTCFTRCTRCDTYLIQQGDRWTPVPKGYRVVWRAADEAVRESLGRKPTEPVVHDRSKQDTAASAEEPFMLTSPAPAESSLQRATILVCDDDPLVTEVVRHKLQSQGWEVVSAADGQRGIELLETSAVDLVVLDAMMPRVDGYEVLRLIREHARWSDLPVIMLTARRQETDVLAGLSLGADEYMVKPFSGEELVTRVGRLLRRRRVQAPSSSQAGGA